MIPNGLDVESIGQRSPQPVRDSSPQSVLNVEAVGDGNDMTANLMALAAAGDRRALAQLTSRYRSRLIGMIRRRLGKRLRRHVESRDIAQDVFAEVLIRFPLCSFRGRSSFVSWLKKILSNKITDQARRAARAEDGFNCLRERAERDGIACFESPSDILTRQANLRDLEAALNALPVRQARILRLKEIDGLDYQTVAREMGLPTPAAARMLRHRAWVALTKELQGRMNGRTRRADTAAP
jgi:RNA polymerase sigma-70 factor, ECF subfamily